MLISVISLKTEQGSTIASGRGTALTGEVVEFMTGVDVIWETLRDWAWSGPLIIDIPSMCITTEMHEH